MYKTFIIILVSVFAFIAVNTIFYINIYNKQIRFQTELLSRQIRICGNTIEQNGLNFENEVNFILFSDDITKLFYDPSIKEIGSKNLELFYSKYDKLINKITIYDNQNNVFSLILDRRNNFVSDYYEAQRQEPLRERDQLVNENGRTYFSIPIFLDNEVHSNIIIDLNFHRYIQTVLDQYKLENTIWQWLIEEDGEIASTFDNEIEISPSIVRRIAEDISEGMEGSVSHTMDVDGESTKVVSVYFPSRLVRQNYGIVFSIKTDLFLRAIIRKTVIITIASILLMVLILYILFRVIKVKTIEAKKHEISGHALYHSINDLPIGVLIINSDNTIRIINSAARRLLFISETEDYTNKDAGILKLDELSGSDHDFYEKAFGEGVVIRTKDETQDHILFKQHYTAQLKGDEASIFIFIDLTKFEQARKLDDVAHQTKSLLLKNMSNEISVPLDDLKNTIADLEKHKSSDTIKSEIGVIKRSAELLENLIKTAIEFSRLEAGKSMQEEIPFSFNDEINHAIEPFRNVAGEKNISIITKIRNDIPDKLVGDPFRIRQVISNLLENALDTTEKGRILVSAEFIEHHKDLIKIKVQVEDTGSGYSGEVIDDSIDFSFDQSLKDQYEETEIRLAIAKQHIELMKGSIWIESPSSISEHPDAPGTKCSFIFEVVPDVINNKGLDFSNISTFNEINCLFLSQINDPEETCCELFEKIGVSVKQRIYSDSNLDSIIESLKERVSKIHILFILDKEESGGFNLVAAIHENNLSDKFLIIIVSYNNLPDNQLKVKKYLIDNYLVIPFESFEYVKIIKDWFPAIPSEAFNDIPKGIKIKSDLSILLAEDNQLNRKVGQTLFKGLGFEIDTAENGNEVLEKVKNNSYDIIFMDLLMPGKDGLETAAELRKMKIDVPIIALTAVESNETKKSAKEAGINDYITKPASAETIREILLKLFAEPG